MPASPLLLMNRHSELPSWPLLPTPQATLHLLRITRAPGGTWSLAATPRGLRPVLATEPGELIDGRPPLPLLPLSLPLSFGQ